MHFSSSIKKLQQCSAGLGFELANYEHNSLQHSPLHLVREHSFHYRASVGIGYLFKDRGHIGVLPTRCAVAEVRTGEKAADGSAPSHTLAPGFTSRIIASAPLYAAAITSAVCPVAGSSPEAPTTQEPATEPM
jgi:hypothetical protein